MVDVDRFAARAVRSARNRMVVATDRLRGWRVQVLHVLRAARVGKRLQVGRNVRLMIYGDLVIGDDVILDDGCMISVGPGARTMLGRGARIGRNTVVAAKEYIDIGDRVLIAEHCSVRDSDHHLDPEERANEVSCPTTRLFIHDDAWIGAGARILRGAEIGAGAIVGANAVVRTVIPPHSIAVGAPARVLRTLG